MAWKTGGKNKKLEPYNIPVRPCDWLIQASVSENLCSRFTTGMVICLLRSTSYNLIITVIWGDCCHRIREHPIFSLFLFHLFLFSFLLISSTTTVSFREYQQPPSPTRQTTIPRLQPTRHINFFPKSKPDKSNPPNNNQSQMSKGSPPNGNYRSTSPLNLPCPSASANKQSHPQPPYR